MKQLITPNPDIPCEPGWCLQYVREAYGLPAVYPTAMASWEASTTQHRDWELPDGVWVPVWFELPGEPAGHVALRAPDGTVYSTSDYATTPHHHNSVNDLMSYYHFYGLQLQYLGWTEDVQGVLVVCQDTIQVESIPTPPEEEMTFSLDELADRLVTDDRIHEAFTLHKLHRACDRIDPTAQTTNVVGTTTEAERIHWMAYNNTKIFNLFASQAKQISDLAQAVNELHTVVNKLTPDAAHTLPVPGSTAPAVTVAV